MQPISLRSLHWILPAAPASLLYAAGAQYMITVCPGYSGVHPCFLPSLSALRFILEYGVNKGLGFIFSRMVEMSGFAP